MDFFNAESQSSQGCGGVNTEVGPVGNLSFLRTGAAAFIAAGGDLVEKEGFGAGREKGSWVVWGDGTGLDFFNTESQRSRSEHRGRTDGDFEFLRTGAAAFIAAGGDLVGRALKLGGDEDAVSLVFRFLYSVFEVCWVCG